MNELNKKLLNNYFELIEIYLKEFELKQINKKQLLEKIRLMNSNTKYMLNIE